MQTAKQDALAAIAAMPDDSRMEDIQYRLYVLERLRAGLEDIETGRVVPHEEVKARLARWLED